METLKTENKKLSKENGNLKEAQLAIPRDSFNKDHPEIEYKSNLSKPLSMRTVEFEQLKKIKKKYDKLKNLLEIQKVDSEESRMMIDNLKFEIDDKLNELALMKKKKEAAEIELQILVGNFNKTVKGAVKNEKEMFKQHIREILIKFFNTAVYGKE